MKRVYYILIGVIAVHIILLKNITFFPNSELFVYPYLTNQGLTPYEDIWDQHTPGLMFFPINFDNLGMNSPSEALLWHIGVVALTHVLIFVVSRKMFETNDLSLLLPNFLYLVFQPLYEGYIMWLDLFLPLFILSALYYFYDYLEDEKIGSLVLAGFVGGLSIVFKQVMLPFVAVLGVYLVVRKQLKPVLVYGFTVLVPVLFMFLYLVNINALDDFWYWAVIYNLTVFAESGTKPIPSLSHFVRFAAIYGLAFYYFILNFKNKRFFLMGLLVVAALASVAARFDFVHLQASLSLGLIIIAFGFLEDKNKLRKTLIIFVYGLFSLSWVLFFYNKHWGRGVTFFDENIYKVEEKVEELAEPGEEIFLYGSPTHIYQMTETVPAGRVFVFQFPWFMEVSEDELLNKLKESNPEVVVRNRSVTMQGLYLVEYAAKLDNYISENYDVLAVYGNEEVMVKKD